MPIPAGSRSRVSYVAEVTAGTTPATPAMAAIPLQEFGLVLNRDEFSDPSINSDRMQRYTRLGNKAVAGPITVSYAADTYDAFLESVFRSAWATNVLKVGTTQKAFTFERAQLDQTTPTYAKFVGCEVAAFKLSVPQQGIVTATFDMIGMDGSISTTALDASVDAAAAGTPFSGFDGTFNEGGSTIATMTSIELTIDNGLAQNYALGTAGSRGSSAGMVNVTGQFTAYFEDSAIYSKFLAESSSSLSFTLTSAEGNHTFSMPKVLYTGNSIPVSGDGPVLQTVRFRALYDSTSAFNNVISLTRT